MKKLKQFIAGFAGFALFMGMFGSASGEVFDDVYYGHENYSAIEYLKDNDVVEGYSDGDYKPENQINRAEFLKILMEAGDYMDEDYSCSAADKRQYKDVEDEWFAPYICKATDLGFVQGYEDGYFRPEQKINFVEASKIVANVLDLEVSADADDVWYKPYVVALSNQSAVPETVKNLVHNVTRGEMAEMVWRIQKSITFKTSPSYNKLAFGVDLASDKEKAEELRSFGSCDELIAYLVESSLAYESRHYGEEDLMAVESDDSSANKSQPVAAEMGAAPGGGDGAEYSDTNVQVEGVDEADIVKTDGEYIYIVDDYNVRVVKAYPPEDVEELSSLDFGDSNDFYPSEMYVDGDKLVVIGSSYNGWETFMPELMIYPPQPYVNLTEIFIFDISDKEDIELFRKVAFDGYYADSRKVDDTVYLVTNKYPKYYLYRDEEQTDGDECPVPYFADSAEGEIAKVVDCGDVMYMPGPIRSEQSEQYLVVAAIPLDDDDSEIAKEVVLGAGGNVYSSRENLYVAESKYSWWGEEDSTEETVIHKFALSPDDIEYKGSGNVPGTILNQFSMDEYDDHFRIATTVGNVWDGESQNNLYVLDEDLEVVGEIEGIAPGERIYSARFMGERAYLVTFKKIDPFFVIDLADPEDPEILGALKIPGYSDYLHPYDENHIIGIGKDTEAATEEELEDWGRDFSFAWYQGIKIAMFDVTDVQNPVELHKTVIGDRGTSSDILYDHKALLFDKEKDLMAFPVTLAELDEEVKNDPTSSGSEYGDYVYQGAYIFDVSVDDGFELRGRITHYDEDEVEDKAGYYWYGDKDIMRILYIGDYFYTISRAMLMVNEMDSLDEVEGLEFEQEEYDCKVCG